MIRKMTHESTDSTIREIHEIREQLSDKFGGDISAILADARQRQEKLGRRVVARGELSGAASKRNEERRVGE